LWRTLETAALLALARRIGLRRGGKLLGLPTAALLDQESAKRHGTRGNEAPMIIGPRDVARLLGQLLATIRGTKTRR
jgi:hypothetical protein